MNRTYNNLVYDYLEEFKIQHATLGYKYLTTALLICLKDQGFCFKTCDLYIAISEKHSPATGSQVERAIRHALSKLPTTVKNSEFIARAVDEILMDIHNESLSQQHFAENS